MPDQRIFELTEQPTLDNDAWLIMDKSGWQTARRIAPGLVAGGGGSTLPVADTQTIVKGSVDDTKLLRFEIDGFTAGATRVLTPPNADATIAGLEVAQTFTAAQKINVNSTTALFVEQDGVHDNVIVADTTNGRVGFGITPTSQVEIQPDATTKVGLIVRASIGSTVDAVQVYDNAGVIGFQFNRFSQFLVSGGIKVKHTAGDSDYVLQTASDTNGDVLIKNRPTFVTHGALQVRSDTNLTNAIRNILFVDHASDQTPVAGFGNGILFAAESSTTEKQSMGRLTWEWSTATHATRKALGKLSAFDAATEREAMRWGVDGTNPTLGFLGATAIARPTAYTQTFSTADRTFAAYTSDPESSAYTGIDNAQAGTPYAQLTDLNALRVAYETLRVHAEDTAQLVNSILDDLQSYGLLA